MNKQKFCFNAFLIFFEKKILAYVDLIWMDRIVCSRRKRSRSSIPNYLDCFRPVLHICSLLDTALIKHKLKRKDIFKTKDSSIPYAHPSLILYFCRSHYPLTILESKTKDNNISK